MKKQLLILSLSAFTLWACGGSQQQNQTADNNTEESTTQQKTYKFVEPTENIAKKIWDAAKASNPEIKPVIDEAINIDMISQDEATDFVSNTYMTYEYIIPMGSEEPDNLLAAQYALKCYQKLDGKWIAFVAKYVHGYTNEDSLFNSKKIFLVDETGATISSDNIFPRELKPFEIIYSDNYENNFVFSNESFSFKSQEFWTVDFVWNGENFVVSKDTPILENRINNIFGEFTSPFRVGKNYRIGYTVDENEIKEDGEVVATLDVKNSVLVGYTVKSKKFGFAQETDRIENLTVIVSKPIAIGYPIKNVLDYKKGYDMKDTTITETENNGKYVITQQLRTDNQNKLDIFIEFTAKDKNSDIEQIRVYSKKNTTTLKSEIVKSELSTVGKQIFEALDMLKPGDTDNREGSFLKENGFTEDNFEQAFFYENGFCANYKEDKSFYFWVYPAKDNGCYYAYFISLKNSKIAKTIAWYYEEGRIDEDESKLSVPKAQDYPAWNQTYAMFKGNGDHTIKPDDYSLNVNYNGEISFYVSSDRNDGLADMHDECGEYKNDEEYKVTYIWDIDNAKFVKK